MAAVVTIDREFAEHTLKAYERWFKFCRESGGTVPNSVLDLAQLCRSVVNDSQPRSRMDRQEPVPQAEVMTPRLHTYEHVRTVLGCSESTLGRHVRRGHLPTVRFGGLVRVRDEDLAAFVDRNRRGNSPKDVK